MLSNKFILMQAKGRTLDHERMPHIQNENCLIFNRVKRGFSKKRVMIHNDFVKGASTTHRGINEGSEVMLGFSICDTTVGIMYTAVQFLLLKRNRKCHY